MKDLFKAFCCLSNRIGTIRWGVEWKYELTQSLGCPGFDPHDSTSSPTEVVDFSAGLQPADALPSRPLEGTRIAVINETVGEGVTPGVMNAFKGALQHLESLGAEICEASPYVYLFVATGVQFESSTICATQMWPDCKGSVSHRGCKDVICA